MQLINGDCLEELKGIETEFGRAWLDSSGHYYVSRKNADRWTTKPLHILVYEKLNGAVPSGMHIHHKDHNPANNDPHNLVAVSQSDHRRIHAGWLRTDDVWTHKPCSVCKQVKTLLEFRSQSKSKFRPQAECKTCDNARRVRRARAKRQTVTR